MRKLHVRVVRNVLSEPFEEPKKIVRPISQDLGSGMDDTLRVCEICLVLRFNLAFSESIDQLN
jgi:hypothetical protein